MSQGEQSVDLDTSTGYLLKQAASALHVAITAVLDPFGLNITQYSSLELLSQRPGLSNSELARGAFVTRQSMNVVLQGLEREGLIARPQFAPVGRSLPTRLTPLGQERLLVASPAVRAVEDAMQSGLDDQESAQLRTLLGRCIRSLQG